MGLQFYFGSSGAGKSEKLHNDIIQWSIKNPEMKFLFVVPDQFTMHTQMDLVKAHPHKGILNIDVLSFGRLAHRIFEEVGGSRVPVLDDTGKSLVLRKVAAGMRDSLPVIGKNLHKQGYIHEVKSAISEFMQYGLGPEQVEGLIAFSESRGALSYKLKDLRQLYQAFLNYIKEQFITTEETLGLLKDSLHKSELIKDSVVIFDGFTGFTPIQNQVIRELMRLTGRVIVSVTIGSFEDVFGELKEQELFYLSKKTVRDLCSLAKEIQENREEDIYLRESPPVRFRENGEMAHLEKAIFRYPIEAYSENAEKVTVSEVSTVKEEVRQACIRIKELVLEKGYCYRDIAVITGDLGTYGGYMEREAAKYDMPIFMDRTRGILLNPFVEYIRSALNVINRNFSYDAVFHYLRSGLPDFSREEIDCLENYVISHGIKGKAKWSQMFTRRSHGLDEEGQLNFMEGINRTREKMMGQLSPLLPKMLCVQEMINALYTFIVNQEMQKRLAVYEERFRERGDAAKAREYGQIYRLVMELLDQIYALLSKENMTLQEFADILDAGFGEIQVGIIPQNIDRVVVGDMERTRLNNIKVMFFLGVNDGNIPRNNQKGGIISDFDREFLQESEFELAPTPRQKMYTQRLYLYMNMTKPSDYLFLSYAKVSAEGKSIRPSYLIENIKNLFPQLEIQYPELQPPFMQIVGRKDSMDVFTLHLRNYAEGSDRGKDELFALCHMYESMESPNGFTEQLIEAAFTGYTPHPLSHTIAQALYGSILENSVSRLEKYAACAYAHFLQYGLALREREEFSFEQVDLGNVFHGVLEIFAGNLAKYQYTWLDFPDEEGDRILREALEAYAVNYGETILFSSARNEQMVQRIYRILKRTVRTLKWQLQKGAFMPDEFEVSFSRVSDLESVNIALSEQETMRLRGRIDRIDTCQDAEHVYVKVIDYKSGNKKFDLAALYYGLQLQLVVYMNVALEMKQREHPDKQVIPAALLYYHVSDPMIKEEDGLTPEEVNKKLLMELRMNGVVNDNDFVIGLLDKEFAGKSSVVPVERKKDGSYSMKSSIMNENDFQTISNYVNHKIQQFGKEIMAGNIAVSPYERGNESACTYCAYASVCGYDPRIPGYSMRKLEDMEEDVIMESVKRITKVSEDAT